MRQRRRARGQALIEFALTLPLLLLLLLGVLDAGRGVAAAITLSNAAREGARYGALHWRAANWQAQARATIAQAAVGLDPSQLQVTQLEYDTASQLVSVSLAYSFSPAAPLLSAIMSSVVLSADAGMLAP